MSFENDGLSASWEEIKAASRQLGQRVNEELAEKRVVRRYLQNEDSEDLRVQEHLAIPGYN